MTIEIYTKDWCPYCSKAKSLLKSKQLDYREIDITSDLVLEQEMVKRANRQSVPQVFIDSQSIGGYDDLAQLNATGKLDQLLGIKTTTGPRKIYDVAIIGAGPAGLAAAIYTVRKNLDTIMIAFDLGGQMGTTYEIANYPGLQQVTGPDLVQQFVNHTLQYPVEKMLGESVTEINFDGRCKVLKTASGKEIVCRAVIIATGAFKRKLGIPGEDKLNGKGVVYCSTCDGPLFRDKTIAVVGGGNAALEAAIEMNGIANKVYMLSRSDWSGDKILQDKAAAAKNIEVLKFTQPLEIHGDDKVEGLTVNNLKTEETQRLELDAVFIEIGFFPNSGFVLDLLETNETGEIMVGRDGDTGVRGIFAVGDVSNNREKQIVIAAGEGARSALAVAEFLMKQV